MGKPFKCFYKNCERYIHNSLDPFVGKYLSALYLVTEKLDRTNGVLIRFNENWKQLLDNSKYSGIAKLLAY